MIARKDLLKYFKAAPWKSQGEVDAFVQAIGQVEPNEVVRMLELLTNKRLAADLRSHRTRCRVFSALADPVADKGLFLPYLKALKGCDGDTRTILVTLLPKVQNVREHDQLCALLRSSEPEVRKAAGQVLQKVGGKTALRLLGEMLEERNFAGRIEAIDVLAAIAGHYAIPSFGVVLRVGKPPEKMRALQYLGDSRFMGKDVAGATRAIVHAFDDANELVVTRAIGAFAAVCDEEQYFDHVEPFVDHSSVRIAQAAIQGLQRFSSPRTIGALERKLHSGPNALRLAVLSVLEQIGTEEVLQPLVQALEHNQVAIRTRAGEVLSALSRAGKVDITRTIIWLLRSRNVNVRRMAVETAASIQDKEGRLWPKLLACLRDEDWWVRERVIDALVQMAGSQLTAHIVAYLADPSDVVRRFSVDVLIRLKDPKALGALVRSAQEDADWWVREKALEAIAELKDERAVPYITDLLYREPALRISCLLALQTMEARNAANEVAAMLKDDDSDVRLLALRCLDAFNDPAHANAVLPLAKDEDLKVRKAAEGLLARWSINFGGGQDAAQSLSLLDRLLVAMCNSDADDLILTPGRRAYVKKMGKITPLAAAVFSAEQLRTIIMPHLTVAQVDDLKALRDVDFSYEVKTHGLRFRANVFQIHGGMAMVFRTIKGTILDLEDLGVPPVVRGFGDLKNGLVLVGGPTGSGKSTTLAALIDYINRTSARHIISLEDPIEVVHARRTGLVNQRELGTHTQSFRAALRSTLREDPDVILVGELRDLDTIRFAVTAAETGHLVFGTVHTVSADTSVDRLINAYPPGAQEQVRSMLSDSLRAVLCQYLLRRSDKPAERILAAEVMINNDAIANLIRKGKTFQIPSVIATGMDLGMQSMDNALMNLYRRGIISADDAYVKAVNKADFEDLEEDEASPSAAEAAKTAAAAASLADEAPPATGTQG